MTAADILRERAAMTESVSHAAFAPVSPDFLRAVADLMAACQSVKTAANRVQIIECTVCDGWWFPNCKPRHLPTCPLAALERLIEGERDAER